MNEPDEREEEGMQEQAVLRLHRASADDLGCIVIVGGKWGAGGRVCGHAAAAHVGAYATGDALCRGCERDGAPLGFSTFGAGRDHQYLDHVPTPPAAEQRRAAA